MIRLRSKDSFELNDTFFSLLHHILTHNRFIDGCFKSYCNPSQYDENENGDFFLYTQEGEKRTFFYKNIFVLTKDFFELFLSHSATTSVLIIQGWAVQLMWWLTFILFSSKKIVQYPSNKRYSTMAHRIEYQKRDTRTLAHA